MYNLTLQLDDELIAQLEFCAKAENKSMPQLITDYLKELAEQKQNNSIPQTTQSLIGILNNQNCSEIEYKQYLQDKYL
ncbi:MAG: DUF6364 family protein [Methylococcaceae bacterium]